MLMGSRGGCGDKRGRVLSVGGHMLLCKARSTMILGMEIIHKGNGNDGIEVDFR